MDATAISLSERVDLAFSNATLHWVANQKAVLQGVRNVLKPEGKVFFQMGGKGNASEIFAVIEGVIMGSLWRGYFEGFTPPYHFFSSDDYRPWLVEKGFQPVRVELIPKDMEQRGIDGLLGWLRTTWFPYTDCLPIQLREDFLKEVAATFARTRPADESGNLHVKMVRLEVEASVE
jgi:trans-aconitate methyltransferase